MKARTSKRKTVVAALRSSMQPESWGLPIVKRIQAIDPEFCVMANHDVETFLKTLNVETQELIVDAIDKAYRSLIEKNAIKNLVWTDTNYVIEEQSDGVQTVLGITVLRRTTDTNNWDTACLFSLHHFNADHDVTSDLMKPVFAKQVDTYLFMTSCMAKVGMNF